MTEPSGFGPWQTMGPGVDGPTKGLPVEVVNEDSGAGGWLSLANGPSASPALEVAALALIRGAGPRVRRVLDMGTLQDGTHWHVTSRPTDSDGVSPEQAIQRLLDLLEELARLLRLGLRPADEELDRLGSATEWTRLVPVEPTPGHTPAIVEQAKAALTQVLGTLEGRGRRGRTQLLKGILRHERDPGDVPGSLLAITGDVRAMLVDRATSVETSGPWARVVVGLRRHPWAMPCLLIGLVGACAATVALISAKERAAQRRNEFAGVSLSSSLSILEEEFRAEIARQGLDLDRLRQIADEAARLESRGQQVEELRERLASSSIGSWKGSAMERRSRASLEIRISLDRQRLQNSTVANSTEERARLNGNIATGEKELAELSSRLGARNRRFQGAREAWLDSSAAAAMAAWERAFDSKNGWVNGRGLDFGPGLVARLRAAEQAQDPAQRALVADAWTKFEAWLVQKGAPWDEVRRRHVRTPDLVFVGIDRDSKLPEFDFATGLEGVAPLRMVLLPGGPVAVGVQNVDPGQTNHFTDMRGMPAHGVSFDDLAPLFLSKHELTQAQWTAWTGSNPSSIRPETWAPGMIEDGSQVTAQHPAESMRPEDARTVLASVGLELPSESQWEYACLAGEFARWPTGNDPLSLEGFANVFDLYRARFVRQPGVPAQFSDGYGPTAPVGSFRPNRFGFHDMIGNVAEICLCTGLDRSGPSQDADRGIRHHQNPPYALRGGSCRHMPLDRTAFGPRDFLGPAMVSGLAGIRPARTMRK